jgi:cold shock protein
MDKTYTGVVKKVMEKGFGFIKCEELGKDVFYHNNNLPANLKEKMNFETGVKTGGLREGDRVTFTVEMGPKGESAMNIQLVEESSEEMAA